jgi:DNA-binding XRE family transcriptional regulator
MSMVRTTTELGFAVRNIRRQRGWTQATLAAAAGVSRQTVIGLERGNPHGEIGVAFRVFAALGVAADLVGVPSAPTGVLDALLDDLGGAQQ